MKLARLLYPRTALTASSKLAAEALLKSPLLEQMNPPPSETKLAAVLEELLPYEQMVAWTAGVYEVHFTEQELSGLLQFYSLPAAERALVEKEAKQRPELKKQAAVWHDVTQQIAKIQWAHYEANHQKILEQLGLFRTPAASELTCPKGQKPEENLVPQIQRKNRGCADKKGKQGLWTREDAGRVTTEATYRDDKLHGKRLVYHPDGAISEEYWANGIREGVQTEYDEKQKRIFTETIAAGKRVKIVLFAEDGSHVIEKLEKRGISAVMRRLSPDVTDCYEKELDRSPELSGNIFVSFMIEPYGAVSEAKVKETTLKNNAVERCVLEAVKRTLFPPAGPTRMAVTYPFSFAAR